MNYKHFGVMLDCSRNAVATVDTIKDLMRHLAKMGYNAVELYTEDTYEINGGTDPYFGQFRGRYTAAEIKELDAYAKTLGIELIPCVQTLAHFTNLVKQGAYGNIVDYQDILLIDDERTYELIDRIFATLAENFTSRLVNIGMDEAWMVGFGEYRKKHGIPDRYDILLRHLNRVADIAKKYGFTAHMWSDMFFRIAGGDYYIPNVEIPEEVKKKVPENVELVYWDYYHVGKEMYDGMMKTQKGFGKNVWFAGGAWTWMGFAPLNEFSLLTMRSAMECVVEHGVQDVFLTMWGDDGGECSFYSVLPALYAIRQYADGNFDEESIKKGFKETFGVDYDDFMLLDLLHTYCYNGKEWRFCNPTKALLYNDCFIGKMDSHSVEEKPEEYLAHAKKLKAAAKRAGKYAYLFDELAVLCELTAVKGQLGRRTRQAYQSGDKKAVEALLPDYAKSIRLVKKFYAKFKALWDLENKPFGWEVQDVRFGGLICRLTNCKQHLEAYVCGKIAKIDELEEPELPFVHGQKYLGFNYYRQSVSASEI
ncbi:MAG: beta-N-acetylhexosaminidase [Clostridia bacterium]|nr:beta-N-acetylhexosaminidase [Clostridia bacterium]